MNPDIDGLKQLPPWRWPEKTKDLVLSYLRDPGADPGKRFDAASMAGDLSIIDDALATALLDIVRDNDADGELRGRAAIALGPVLETVDMMGCDDDDEAVCISENVLSDIQAVLVRCYRDGKCPKETRRRVLEASVRAPLDWHGAAIRSAYQSGDPEWRLTAVFCMNYVPGFEAQILESLKDDDADILYEAVCAAGSWAVVAAWPRIVELVCDADTEKTMRLAAIDASVNIRPEAAAELLEPLMDDDDPDLVDAAHEAAAMAETLAEIDMDEDDD